MIVAVDVGNSRTKWAIFDPNGDIAQRGVADNRDLAPLQAFGRQLPNAARIVMACVADEAIREKVLGAFAPAQASVLEIQPQAHGAGVSNGYAEPRQLGVDRWAALVAAWQMYRRACVVVNAGTALTVDALSSRGEFLGGLIVPGLNLMTRALFDGTAGIAAFQGATDWQDFPRSTHHAVYCGSVAAMAGAVRHMAERLAEREGITPLYLCSGGDIDALQPLLPDAIHREPDLVLKGLFYLETLA